MALSFNPQYKSLETQNVSLEKTDRASRVHLDVGEFFMLFMKTSLMHSSSPADMLHFLAISAKAPQNCSNESLSLCFLFNSLRLSNVTFVFLTKAVVKFSLNSLKEIRSIFTFVSFWPKFFFPLFSRAS